MLKPATRLLPAFILLLLAACASSPPAPTPSASSQAPSATLALPALLAASQQWSGQTLTLVAPLSSHGAGRVLSLPAAGSSSPGIWLAQPLTDDILGQLDGATNILKLHGVLSPPGAYGRDQRFPYQFTADRVTVLRPERTRIDNLALNPGALDLILLRLEGTLLARADSALLIDRVTDSGVPLADAQQIKLSSAGVEPALTAALRTSGDVRWGQVAVVGWWQGGSLIPLAITQPGADGGAPPAEPSATSTP